MSRKGGYCEEVAGTGGCFAADDRALAACGTSGGSASAQAFYKGQTVNYIISSRVGSGTDTTARYLAPSLKESLGATVVIQNMDKVGSLEGVNYVAVKAKPDGLTFGIVASGAMFPTPC